VIGYTNRDNAVLLRRLFEAPYFRITLVNDVVSFCLMGGWDVLLSWVLRLANIQN
jgi:glycerol-3-phosphate dehydrogenase